MKAWCTGILGLAAFVAVSATARADAFSVGAGANLAQFNLAGIPGSADSAYFGPGLLVDVRARFGPAPTLGEFGLDLFGALDTVFAPNRASSEEMLTQVGVGGGLDVRTGPIFVGTQLQKMTTTVRSTTLSTSSTLAWTSIGLRAGVNVMLTSNFSLALGGMYQTGVANGAANGLAYHQPMSQVQGFAVLHFKLIKGAGAGASLGAKH